MFAQVFTKFVHECAFVNVVTAPGGWFEPIDCLFQGDAVSEHPPFLPKDWLHFWFREIWL